MRIRADCSQFGSVNSFWQFIYLHNWIKWFGTKIRNNTECGSQFLRQLLLTLSKILLKTQKEWKFSKKMEDQDWHSTNCQKFGENSTNHKTNGEGQRNIVRSSSSFYSVNNKSSLVRRSSGALFLPTASFLALHSESEVSSSESAAQGPLLEMTWILSVPTLH